MYDEIVAVNVEGLYGGGFYKLLNIRESEQTQAFYDIYLLAETVKDIDLLKKVKDLNDKYSDAKAEKPINSVLARAIRSNPPGSMRDVAAIYSKLFGDVDVMWQKALGRQTSRSRQPKPLEVQ